MKKIINLSLALILVYISVGLNFEAHAYYNWKPKGWAYTRSVEMTAEDQTVRLVNLINDHRAYKGLAPLIHDAQLDTVALEKTKRVHECPGFIEHQACGIDVFQELNDSGYEYNVARENLAHYIKGNEYHVFRMWMASPEGHYETMISDCTHVGVGVLVDVKYHGKTQSIYTLICTNNVGNTWETESGCVEDEFGNIYECG